MRYTKMEMRVLGGHYDGSRLYRVFVLGVLRGAKIWSMMRGGENVFRIL